MSPRSGAGFLAVVSVLAGAVPAVAQAPGPGTPVHPSSAHAHLSGKFLLAGVVTVASDIPGEHAGQRVMRTWTFIAPCPSGSCSTTTLLRPRAHARDRVLLRRHASGYYVGKGSFYAPVRCGSHKYARGALVPYTIAVRVTSVSASNGVVNATRIRATYVNRERTNLTRCVAALGHDSARYHGHVVLG